MTQAKLIVRYKTGITDRVRLKLSRNFNYKENSRYHHYKSWIMLQFGEMRFEVTKLSQLAEVCIRDWFLRYSKNILLENIHR